jgi:hypothetical protein
MIQYFPIVTGSLTVSGSLLVSGGITASGGISISGSIASASYAASASNALAAQSASYVLTAQSASFVALAQSASNAVVAQTSSYANNLTVAGTLTAQTLVVQTITSSVDFVTGSTRFGSISANTHVFTGSMSVSGSIVTIGSITSYNALQTFSNVNDATPAQLVLSDTSNTRQLLIGYNSGSNYGSIQAIHQGVAYKNLVLNLSGGNVGIGISNPSQLLEIANTSGNAYTKLTADFGSAFIGMETADDSMRILTAQATPIQFYTNNALRMIIANNGSIGIGISSPTASLTVVNSVVGTPSIPSLGSVNVYTTAYFTNANPSYGLLIGSLNNGNSWMQVGRVDGSATAYDLQLQPNGGNVRVGGSIVSTTGQFGTEKTVQINALNTSYLIFSGAPSGIVSARDNTNGGSGLWLLDPNGNGGTATLVAQNWINGAYTVFYSGGNTYVQKTSGNVPVIFHYAIYGN